MLAVSTNAKVRISAVEEGCAWPATLKQQAPTPGCIGPRKQEEDSLLLALQGKAKQFQCLTHLIKVLVLAELRY